MAGLTDRQIVTEAKRRGLPLIGVFLKDSLPLGNPSPHGLYVFNLDNSDGEGTHWTAAFTRGKEVTYFDSFGFPPPVEIVRFLKRRYKKVGWNGWVLQSIKSTVCGWWVIAFGEHMANTNGPLQKDANDFLCQFGSDFTENDRSLRELLA